jgi:hypothetical protein
MEGKAKTDVCRFFLKGQCKNGERCAFEHPQHKEKTPQQNKEIPRLPQQDRQPSQEKTEVEIKDPEAVQKLRYLAGLKAALRQSCSSCKSKRQLPMISCGCMVLCRSCAVEAKTCPIHKTNIDLGFIIGGDDE